MKRLLIILWVCTSPLYADRVDSDLYYEAEKAFSEKSSWEVRLGAGYDLSNPYLNVFSFQGAAYRLLDPTLALGVEATGYASSTRGSTKTIQQELGRNGFLLESLAPQYKVTFAARFTPISGLANLLSQKIVRADLHLLARAGVVQYKTVPLGPVVGLGLETQVGLTPQWGLYGAVFWDIEKPGKNDWQQRTGFMFGPSYRF